MEMWWLVGGALLVVMAVSARVSYDGRSLMIDGERKMLFSGSIHYPRSTPHVCLSLSFFIHLSISSKLSNTTRKKNCLMETFSWIDTTPVQIEPIIYNLDSMDIFKCVCTYNSLNYVIYMEDIYRQTFLKCGIWNFEIKYNIYYNK